LWPLRSFKSLGRSADAYSHNMSLPSNRSQLLLYTQDCCWWWVFRRGWMTGWADRTHGSGAVLY
jgi:hypothetical protein